jgi:hypothetical protein
MADSSLPSPTHDEPPAQGWWKASDGNWYPPESPPGARAPIGRPRSVGLTILVSVVTLGIWTWVWSYWNGEELKTYRREGLGGVAYLLLTIFISPVTMFLLAGEVERLYTQEGEQPRITAMWGLWFLLPLIGNIIWYVRIQRAINEFWQARGGTPSPGLT